MTAHDDTDQRPQKPGGIGRIVQTQLVPGIPGLAIEFFDSHRKCFIGKLER